MSNPENSHCAVEWDEEGKPVSVVMAKDVKSVENEGHGNLIVGDVCQVSVKKGNKTFTYNATLLGIGESVDSSCDTWLFIKHIILFSGTKNAMDSLLNEIEREDDDVDDVEEDPSMEIEVQTHGQQELEKSDSGEEQVEVESRTKSRRKRPAVSLPNKELTKHALRQMSLSLQTEKRCSKNKKVQLENARASKEILAALRKQASSSESDESEVETHASKKKSTVSVHEHTCTLKNSVRQLPVPMQADVEDVPCRVTREALLSGLGDPSTLFEESRITPPPTTPTLPFNPPASPCLSPFSPRAHSTLLCHHPLRDVTNGNQVCVYPDL